MKVSIFAPPNMKVDIGFTVNLENTHMDGTHMDGHSMSLSVRVMLRWSNYLPGNYWVLFWDAAADLVTPLVAQVVLQLYL